MGTLRIQEWVAFSLAAALILAGFGLLILGAESPVKLEIWGIKLESSSLGIVVVVLGVGLVGLILKNLGKRAETSKPGEATAGAAAPDLSFALTASALDGHPIGRLEESEVFCGGASVTITMSHDLVGSRSIVVDEIEIRDVRFEPGSHPDLHYKIEANKIFGAGMKVPDRYSISLLGEKVLPAKWQDKEGEPGVARSANLLTASGRYPQLYPGQGEDVEMIEIQVLPQEIGYYEITFEASYLVGDVRNRTLAGPVRMYYE